MAKVRVYLMTIASRWYDEKAENLKEYELHFRVARHGKIETVRRHLIKRGIPYFQQRGYRQFGKWIRKRRIRARFQREQPALNSQHYITVEGRRMEYRGKRWNASALPTRKLSYARRRRKRQ